MGWARVVIALLVVTEFGLLAAFFPLPGTLRKRQAKVLAQLPAKEAVEKLRTMENLPAEFLPAVVDLLNSQDHDIATAARLRLANELRTWRELPLRVSRPLLLTLSSSVADQVHSFNTFGKRQATKLAEAILNYPLPPAEESLAVFDQCNLILRRTRHVWNTRPKIIETAKTDVRQVSTVLSPEKMVVNLPGGGVPLVPSELPTEARSLPIPAATRDETGEPRIFDPPSTVIPPRPNLLPSGPARPLAPAQPKEGDEPLPLLPEMTDSLGFSAETPSIRLIQALKSTNNTTRAIAERLLRSRGFGQAQFEMAKQLFSSDARARQALAERLPSLRDIDPFPWLILLATDADADVRLVAVSILGTARRKSLQQELERLEKNERDARVLSRIRQAIKMTRGEVRR